MLSKALPTLLLLLALTPLARAHAPAAEERLDRLERELQQLRQLVADRDIRIAALERELAHRHEATPATHPEGISTADVERTRQAVERDLSLRPPLLASGTAAPTRSAPDIAVIINALGSISDRRSNNAFNRFDVGSVELDLRQDLGRHAQGVVVLAFEREVENPLFPGDEEEGESGPENVARIEEAFVLIRNVATPNLTAKLGRFHLRFGKHNTLHSHETLTADVPLAIQSFLSPEALIDAGLSLSYVIPPERMGGQHVELTAEIISGEGADSESPTLKGDFSIDSPAINLHALWNTDLRSDLNLELGASYLWGRGSADNSEHVHLFGLDATLIRRDPTGGFNDQVFQAEWIYGLVDQPDGRDRQRSMGFYLLFQQQLARDWYAGIRGDWTQDANDDSRDAWAISPYVTWQANDFLRLRAQYQYRDVDGESPAHILWFQVTAILGTPRGHVHDGRREHSRGAHSHDHAHD